jgi:hypothetical protein
LLFFVLIVLSAFPTEKCLGQGCPGEYYERAWVCMNDQKDYCYSDDTPCSKCDSYTPCVGKGDVKKLIDSCRYVCPAPPDTLTVAGSVSCAASGVEDWCRGSATLNLSAVDSLSHAVTFTGSGVVGFPCTGPCAIGLPAGQGTVTYAGTCTGGLTASGAPISWKLDLTLPAVNSSLSGGTAGNSPWYRAGPVSITCTASDSPSGIQTITYNPQVANGDGQPTLRCTATDKAGNTTQATQLVRIDGTAPTIANSLSGGTAGGGGWYRAGPVNLNCAATDATSGVQGVAYNPRAASANGPTTLRCTATDVAGNARQFTQVVSIDATVPTVAGSVSGGTSGNSGWYLAGPVTYSCSATDTFSGMQGITYNPQTANGDGQPTLRCTATDKAGNTTQATQLVRIDGTAPNITGSLSGGTAGSGGWYRGGPVNLNCAATDATSGVQGIAYNPRIATTNGATTLRCTGTDVAGNARKYSQVVSIDATPPVVTGSVSGGTSGNPGWYLAGPVTMSCNATDTFSGLQGIAYNPQTANGDGQPTLCCTATDKAGNTTQATQLVRIDGTEPTVSDSLSGGIPGNGGWYRGGPVNLNCAATDATSGVQGVTYNPQTASADGSSTLACTVLDRAGNSAQTSQEVRIDSVSPAISSSVSGGTHGSGGWYLAGPVSISCSASDTLSGLEGIAYDPQVANGDGQTTIRCIAADVAGNTAQASQLVPIDGTAPAISTSISSSAPGDGGWYRGPASLHCDATDAISGVQGISYNPQTAGVEGSSTLACSASDQAGNTAQASQAVRIDSAAPSISTSVSGGTHGSGGWYLAGPVSLNCDGTDATSGLQGITYDPRTASGDGQSTLSCTASDLAGNITQASRQVGIDGMAPTITGSISGGTMGNAGWYTGVPVSLNCSATDATSGLEGITYDPQTANADGPATLACTASDRAGNTSHYSQQMRIDSTKPGIASSFIGGMPGSNGWYLSGPVSLNCSATDATSGLHGILYSTQTAIGEGQTALGCSASDWAGNTAEVSRTVRIDGTAPTITGSISGGAPGNGGWYRAGPVNLNCAATDATSGVQGITYNPQTATANGATTLRCTATDVAGNARQYSQEVRIDATPPVVTGSVSGGTSGKPGWYLAGPVTLTCGATDTFSGLQGITYNPQTANGDGQPTLRCTATDKVGNTAQAAQLVRIDGTAPTVSGSLSGGIPGDGGWYRGGPVDLNCAATDATSGVQGITYNHQTASADGEATLACTAADRAGNTGRLSKSVQIDGAAPVITGALSGGTPGKNGWYVSGPVALRCKAADSLSGVAGITYGVQSATTLGGTVLDCSAKDKAGNSGEYSTTVLIDTVPPAARFEFSGQYCANGWYHSAVTVSLAANDAHSGVASALFSLDGGSTWQTSYKAGDGIHDLIGKASDVAGNDAQITGQLRIDTAEPQSEWDVEEGRWVGGVVELAGRSVDSTSGISKIAVSTDGGTNWIDIGSASPWTFRWDTAGLQDGEYLLLARVTDNACNGEHTAKVTVHVDNTPPRLTLRDTTVAMGGETAILAEDAGSGLGSAQVTISGSGIVPRVIAYAAPTGAEDLAWDGRGGNGNVAPFGEYEVLVEVWDKVGNYSSTLGKWLQSRPGESMSAEAAGAPIAGSKSESAEPTGATVSAHGGNLLVWTGVPFWALVLPLGGMTTWLVTSSAAFARDRRWEELRGLRASLMNYRKQGKSNFPGGDEDD